jgi:hypothetical protein
MNINQQLDKFIADAGRSPRKVKPTWLHTPELRIFVRKSHRVFRRGEPIANTTLDVAVVEVASGRRKKRLLKDFLEYAEKIIPWDAVFIEDVRSDSIRDYLERTGWQKAITPLCYFKMNSNRVNNDTSIDDLECDNMPDSYVVARMDELKGKLDV